MPSVSEFLVERMSNSGINHVFGVPGDYILKFFKKLSDSKKIDLITTTDENHAGFAADGYARVNGIGCVAVTYNVGALKIANAVAGAYAERSPLVVISGSPGMKERDQDVLLHHMVRSFGCQKQVFDNITCASTVLDDPDTAGYEIDRVLEALKHHKQPVYIELPRDIAEKPIGYNVYKQGTPTQPKSDPENLQEALGEVVEWINRAESPVILAGVQLARYEMGAELVKFAEKNNIPIATTLLSKSVVGERHQLFTGVYAGAASSKGVRELVENSDCCLMFGVMLTDMNLAFLPSKFQKRQTMACSVEGLKVKNHTYTGVTFQDFSSALFKSTTTRRSLVPTTTEKVKKTFTPNDNTKVTVSRLFEKVDAILDQNMAIIADVGDALFGSIDLTVHHRNHFLSPAFYASMGFAIPASLGVQSALPQVRPIVLVGDGAFQMSCSELSTILTRGLNPIVLVLNNRGYTTERLLLDGPFNDIANWEYHKITDMIGGGFGVVVDSEVDLDSAITYALKSKTLSVINILLSPGDVSAGLKRMTDGLGSVVKKF